MDYKGREKIFRSEKGDARCSPPRGVHIGPIVSEDGGTTWVPWGACRRKVGRSAQGTSSTAAGDWAYSELERETFVGQSFIGCRVKPVQIGRPVWNALLLLVAGG